MSEQCPRCDNYLHNGFCKSCGFRISDAIEIKISSNCKCGKRGREFIYGKNTDKEKREYWCYDCHQKRRFHGFQSSEPVTFRTPEEAAYYKHQDQYLRALFYGDNLDIFGNKKPIDKKEETDNWLNWIKTEYSNHFDKCKAEVDCYRFDPGAYMANVFERLQILSTKMQSTILINNNEDYVGKNEK
ncbi:MAG: hypothetical protein WC495_06295 [Patescibacteria group bacterium]